MSNNGSIFKTAITAGLETSLLLTPLGMVLFYPFVSAYELMSFKTTALYSLLGMFGFGLLMTCIILIPATYILKSRNQNISRKELTGSLGTLALLLVLGATLIYTGFDAPGDIGKLLLFGLLMAIMAVTWTFAFLYDRNSKTKSEPNSSEQP